MTLACLSAVLLAEFPKTRRYEIEGATRIAVVHGPTAATKRPPLVFGFHGLGGSVGNAARSFQIQALWPEAVVVYMQGLPRGDRFRRSGRPGAGWQVAAGQDGDRDLKFFDAVYADLVKAHGIDADSVYALGHSNGGRFTYLLMQQRGGLFAAFAPSGSPSMVTGMPRKPVFHIAGEQDALVNFDNQRRTLDLVKQRNKCAREGTKLSDVATLFKGTEGNDVVAYFHPGGHEYPREDAPKMIVEFFKAHKRR